MNESGKIKKGLGALDVMILILLAVVIGYVGLRVFRNRGSGSEQSAGSHYTIEFRIQDIRNSSYENYLFQQKGTTFYMKDSGEEFGVLLENAAPTPAEKFYELSDGKMVSVTTSIDESSELYRVDVTAQVDAVGVRDGYGIFCLGGKDRIVPNQEFTIYSRYVTYKVQVLSIHEND